MLNKHNLAIANIAASATDKYAISGVWVEPHCTVATDGHRLMIVSLPKVDFDLFPAIEDKRPLKEFTPFTIPREPALNIAKQIPKSKIHHILENVAILGVKEDKDTHRATEASLGITDLDTHHVFHVKTVGTAFANWRSIIPDLPTDLIDTASALSFAADKIRKHADGLINDCGIGLTFNEAVGNLRDLANDIEHSQSRIVTQVGITIDVLVGVLQEFKRMGIEAIDLRFKDQYSPFRLDGIIEDTEQSVTAIVMARRSEFRTPLDMREREVVQAA